jgi:hypothetical protein
MEATRDVKSGACDREGFVCLLSAAKGDHEASEARVRQFFSLVRQRTLDVRSA